MYRYLFTLFVTLSLSFIISGQTNTYYSFPDSNAVWNFHYQMHCMQNGTADEQYSITISGDTLINNQQYKKLTTPFNNNNSSGTCGGKPIGYKGAIRHDSVYKKVYFIPPSDSAEHILYDFTLTVGDTLRGFLADFDPVVQKIDSVQVGNSYRKRWVIDSSCYFINIIEGIGSTYGLIELIPPCITDLADYSLLCFQHNQDTFNNSNCQLITTIREEKLSQEKFKIYPNPSSGSIQFESYLQLQSVEVYNIHGQMLKSFSPQDRSWQLPEEKGLYLIRLQNKDGDVYTEKVIRK